MLARWEQIATSGGELRVFDEMTQLALVIIGDVLFGLDMRDDVPEMTGAAQDGPGGAQAAGGGAGAAAPLGADAGNRRFNGAMRTLHAYIDDILHSHARRRRRGARLPEDAHRRARSRERLAA